VREIDGASHNSVDNVRDLIDSFKSLPPPGYRFKVYIIDEVHMLSVAAFNALLKSLEEPPPNTVFILATTEVHKIPETVISRCQRHDFRALSVSMIEGRLREVCAQEGVQVEPEALRLVARLADGSMRDAQTLLDRVQSFCSGVITAEDTSKALGTVEQRVLVEVAQSIVSHDVSELLARADRLFSTGIDPLSMLREFVHFWRELFIAKLGGEARLRALGISDDAAVELLRIVSGLEAVDLQDLWDMAREGAERCARSAHPRFGFEALVVRMATRQPVATVGEAIGHLIGTAAQSSAAAPARPAPAARGATVTPAAAPAPVAPSAPASARVSTPTPGSVASAGTVAPSGSVAGSPLDWHELIGCAGEVGGKVLAENLKRLMVTRFELGIVEGTAAEFSISSVNHEREKVCKVLDTYVERKQLAKPTRWNLVLTKGEGALGAVAAEKAAARADAEQLGSHPAVQSLQKVFPGSKVEQVRVKS
jgi:DNA polymerase-3 subunit gamma/tau